MGYTYKTVNHASILNLLRKNIALMTRNVDPDYFKDDASLNRFDFILQNRVNEPVDPDYVFDAS